MPRSKWKTFAEINPERKYLAFAKVGQFRNAWSFLKAFNSGKVERQLKTTKGLVGFTGRLGFLNKEIAMLVVFENEDALNEFAYSEHHVNCMKEIKPLIKDLKIAKLTILGSNLPPSIDEVISRA
jgi:hypothetical protein